MWYFASSTSEGLVHKPGQGPLERWGNGANVLKISETYFRSSEGDSPGGRSYEQAHVGVQSGFGLTLNRHQMLRPAPVKGIWSLLFYMLEGARSSVPSPLSGTRSGRHSALSSENPALEYRGFGFHDNTLKAPDACSAPSMRHRRWI